LPSSVNHEIFFHRTLGVSLSLSSTYKSHHCAIEVHGQQFSFSTGAGCHREHRDAQCFPLGFHSCLAIL
jgi:hypothetical protein